MEGKVTSVYYRDLKQEEKDILDKIERNDMLKRIQNFVADPRYEGIDPESIWYLKLSYINNWVHPDNYIVSKCECGSLEFDCLEDKLASNGLDRDCLYKCCKCGKVHREYD